MKPSLTPCSFSNFSWKRLRMSMTGAMFTSLKVVRMALLACDCSRRSAMRARRRVMATRSSGRSPRSGAGAGACGRMAAGTPVGMDAAEDGWGAETAAAAGAVFACATAASTSPLVMRPSLPVPATALAVSPCSDMSFAAAGMAMAEAAAACTGCGAGAAPFGVAAVVGIVEAPTAASVSICAMG